jgi:hypothetical protein
MSGDILGPGFYAHGHLSTDLVKKQFPFAGKVCSHVTLDIQGWGGSAMPYTPEAQAKRAKIAAIYGWFRQRLVLLIVCSMLFLQFMTWRAIVDLQRHLPSDPADCNSSSPCTVQLTDDTIRQLAARLSR